MASKHHNVEERLADSAVANEKAAAMHSENFHDAAERGHLATDK